MVSGKRQPGQAVRGSETGRPVMAALDLLGRRWTLRILWELQDGPLTGLELQVRCDQMSTSVLYQRLAELAAAGVIERDDSSTYALTRIGADLRAALDPLDKWSQRWARTLS